MALAGKRSKRRKVDFSSGLAKNIVPLWRRKLSAASTQGNAASPLCLRRQEPYGNFRDALDRLKHGGEYYSRGEAVAAARPTLIEFAVELKRRP
jgi:hypothetical protein